MNYWIAANQNGAPALDANGRPQIIGSLTKSKHCLCPAPAGLGNGDGEIVRVFQQYDDPNTGQAVELESGAPTPTIKHKPPGAGKALAVVPLIRWAAAVDEDARKQRDARRKKAAAEAAKHDKKNAYRQARKMEYATRLSGDSRNSSLLDALGDVVDVLIKRVREIEAAGVKLPKNKEWTALVEKIDAIKAEHPKG